MARHDGRSEGGDIYDRRVKAIGLEQEDISGRTSAMTSRDHKDRSANVYNPYYTGRPQTPINSSRNPSVDRQEIIRRIKSRESRPSSPEVERPSSWTSSKAYTKSTGEQANITTGESRVSTQAAEVDSEKLELETERPRSAYHRGDFRDVEREESTSAFERFGESFQSRPTPSLSTSPVAPWHANFPSGAFRPQSRPLVAPATTATHTLSRPRAVSSAPLPPAFVYRPPTSPLVQASRPDTPEPPTVQSSGSPDKSRRRTFSPQVLQRYQSALDYPNSTRRADYKQSPTLRSEQTVPYQAHQPRRSLNSYASLPQTPVQKARRPSLSESPLHHATLVGSYEESILRGRMSTTPSKPLDFIAQIGVLGKGRCRPSLQCPPHATVPFPAVFYSYGSSTKALSTADQPSPYVGLVDLEHNLPPTEPSTKKRRRIQATFSNVNSRDNSCTRNDQQDSDSHARLRRLQKRNRRSQSPKAPPGGSYRIPQKGQLQIVIKNPNKTAVKLFLIPYDLSDMEPGQKTFVRQRSYSAGPIIDMPISARTNLGTDRPEASLSTSADPEDRPTLRYLIHLHMCCPSKGRYYLYKSIRVVFANRVPDGKEKLRSEVQLPEPKYSVYKHDRDSNAGIGVNTAVRHSRRASNIDPIELLPHEAHQQHSCRFLAQSLPSADFNPQSGLPMQPMPSYVSMLPTLESRPASRQTNEGMDLDSDMSQETSYARQPVLLSPDPDAKTERKLGEPFSFDRDRSLERYPGARSDSLLSRRLREIALRAHRDDEGRL